MYNIFISHSWDYSSAYERLIDMLDNAPGFIYRDYSVPQSDPIKNAKTNAELRQALINQIRPASVVIIPTGLYANYSEWIQEEIKIAQSMDKPIIAVEPWHQDHTSQLVKQAATDIVAWRYDSIVNAINKY